MTSVPQLLVPGVGGKGPDDQDSDQYLVMFNLKPKVNSWYAESLTAGTGHFSGETRTAQNAPRLVAAPLHGQSSRAETVARGRASRYARSEVGAANDPLEAQADRVAEWVLNRRDIRSRCRPSGALGPTRCKGCAPSARKRTSLPRRTSTILPMARPLSLE